MKADIVGTGMVATAIGSKLAALGHEVIMGSRSVQNPKSSAWAQGAESMRDPVRLRPRCSLVAPRTLAGPSSVSTAAVTRSPDDSRSRCSRIGTSRLGLKEGERLMSVGQRVDVESCGIINAPLAKVWDLVRDFSNVSRWHPDVVDSRIDSGSGDRPGAVREIRLRNGMSIREQLVDISSADHFYTYSVISSPLPIRDHESTVWLTPREASQTEVTWRAQFEVTEGDPRSVADAVRANVIELGIDGLRQAATRDNRRPGELDLVPD